MNAPTNLRVVEGIVEVGDHAYFNSLVARTDHWKSYALRDQAQIDLYSEGTTPNQWVTYDPANDAAKVQIPPFQFSGITVVNPIGPADTQVKLSTINSSITNNRSLKLDDEIVTIVRPSGTVIVDNTITISRGQFGTTPAAHAGGSQALTGTNSLLNQLRVPLGTEDGHVYFFSWEGKWDSSYVQSGISNHKAFQFSAGPSESIWLEPQTRFAVAGTSNEVDGFDPTQHVGVVQMRSYLATGGPAVYDPSAEGFLGVGITKNEPIRPMTNEFIIKPNKWLRFFVRIEQHGNDYDYMDYWVADEDTDPVRIYTRVPMTVKGNRMIDSFWVEFNTSTDLYRGKLSNLVCYVRNVVALKDPAEIETLLQRP